MRDVNTAKYYYLILSTALPLSYPDATYSPTRRCRSATSPQLSNTVVAYRVFSSIPICAPIRARAASSLIPSRFISRASCSCSGLRARQHNHAHPSHPNAPVHNHNLPYPPIDPALNQKRHIQHNPRLAPPPAPHHLLQHLPPHLRVHNPVQHPPLSLVRKHNLPKLLPVESPTPVLKNHFLPECLHDLFVTSRSGFNDLPR